MSRRYIERPDQSPGYSRSPGRPGRDFMNDDFEYPSSNGYESSQSKFGSLGRRNYTEDGRLEFGEASYGANQNSSSRQAREAQGTGEVYTRGSSLRRQPGTLPRGTTVPSETPKSSTLQRTRSDSPPSQNTFDRGRNQSPETPVSTTMMRQRSNSRRRPSNDDPFPPPTSDTSSVTATNESTLLSHSATFRNRIKGVKQSESSKYAGSDTRSETSESSKTRAKTEDATVNLFGATSESAAAAIQFGAALMSPTSPTPSYEILADEMLMQLSVHEAIVDAKRFQILPPEKYTSLKQELKELNAEMAALHTRLTVENRIREAALSLAKLSNGKSKEEVRAAQEQLASASKKVDKISTELWKSSGKVMQVERSVMKHLAGVLRLEAMKKVEAGGNGKEVDVLKRQVMSAEIKLKEQEQVNYVLKTTISRLETESDDEKRRIKKLERTVEEYEDEMRSLRNMEDRDSQTKLQLESARAEIDLLKLDLEQERDMLSELRLQLDEDQNMMDEKDRTISNLLSELEETQTKLEVYETRRSMSMEDESTVKDLKQRIQELERERKRVSVNNAVPDKRQSMFNSQLKDAIMERERLKSELRDEKNNVSELQRKLQEVEETAKSKIHEVEESTKSKIGDIEEISRSKRAADDELQKLRRQISQDADTIVDLKNKIESSAKDSQELRKLYISVPSLNNKYPDSFSISSLHEKVLALVIDHETVTRSHKDCSRKMQIMSTDHFNELESIQAANNETQEKLRREIRYMETELSREKTAAVTSEKQIRNLETRDKTNNETIQKLTSERDSLKYKLETAENRVKDFEMLARNQESNTSKTFEDLRKSHREEMDKMKRGYESDIQYLKSDKARLENSLHVEIDELKQQVDELDRQYDSVAREKDELESQLNAAESGFRKQIETAEVSYRDKIEELKRQHNREIERMEAAAKREVLMKEIEIDAVVEVQAKDAEKRAFAVVDQLKIDHAQQIDKLQNDFIKEKRRLEDEWRVRVDKIERDWKSQIENIKEMHENEKEVMRDSFDADYAKLRKENENMGAAFEQRLQSAIQNERRNHESALQSLRDEMDSQIKTLSESHEKSQSELINRVNRAEVQLVQNRSQFFQDKERLTEQKDRLETELRALKESQLEQFNQNAAKTRDYENTIDTLRYEAQVLQGQIDEFKGLLDQKDRQIAAVEQQCNYTIQQKEEEFKLECDKLHNQLSEYEGIKSELDNIEAEYNKRLAKREQDLRVAESNLTESKERLEIMADQMNSLRIQLERCKAEVEETRAAKLNTQNEMNLVKELERMQMTVVEMKTQKVELLEELDDQHHREQALQMELNNIRRDLDRAMRNLTDCEAERTKLEAITANNRDEIKVLQTKLQDKSINQIGATTGGFFGSASEPPNIQKLRGEFRKQLNDVRDEHTAQLDKEVLAKQALEAEIRRLKRDKEMAEFSKVGHGTQTELKWIVGDVPTKLHSY